VKLRALIFGFFLAGLGSHAMAAGTPTSGNVAPVVLIGEAVDLNRNVTPAGSTSGIGMAGTGFGQSTPKTSLPQSASASLPNLMMPAFNPVSASCPAAALTAGCVLSGAATWITANVTGLQTKIGQFEGSFGYSFAWFTYSQSIQLQGESSPRTLTWSMFVNAQGVGTWGAPQLSAGNGVVLYVRYASLSAPSWVAPSWVTGLNPNAGSVQWQVLDSTLTPIQCADLTVAGCTLPVGGAFDEPVSDFSGSKTNINAGYNALLGPSIVPATAGATVQALLAKTGASFALVDYGYTLLPEYDTVSDGYCPNGAASCARAVGQYTYTALRVDMCTCGTDNYVNTGSYSLALQYQIARNVVSASTAPDGSTAMSSSLLEQFGYTMQSPSIAFNASGASNAGSWVLPITHAQALAVLSAATPQVLLPTDGTKLVDAAALLTPGNVAPAPVSSVINGISMVSASAPPVSLPAVTSTGSDILYWSANPIPGVANTYLAVEARCDANNNTQFISGYNLGAVEATDSNPNGGFINPSWAYAQQASPANTFLTGTASCAGAGTEVDVPNSTSAMVQYFYASSPSCTTLEGTEGAGDVCPSAYTWTSITDPNGDSTGESVCLFCASGSPSAVNNDGNVSYSCSTGGSASQLSSLYEVPLNGGGTTCSQSSTTPTTPSSNSSYGWVIVSDWPASAPSCAWETRVVACEDQNHAIVSNAFCTGPQPLDAQFMTGGCGFTWVAGAWSAPSSACSLSATETRPVICVRGDGSTMPDTSCTDTKPDTSQTLAVSSGCPYQWAPADWGSCTGGTFGWQYSTWTPPSACGQTTQQSRTATGCSATPDSGSASRAVTCIQQSNGATVAVGNCSALPPLGAEPALTETCTPQVTSNGQCGAAGPLSQISSLTDGCFGLTFKWAQSGFAGCTGGTAAWQYTDWAPVVSSGCGIYSQTRNGSCTQTLNSGSATQTISCVGSDGKTYPNGVCTALVGVAPPTNESCTPTGVSCGTEAAVTQNVTLTDQCAWAAGTWSACGISASTCPEGSHPQSGCGDPLPSHVGSPAWNSSWVSDDAQGIPASELNFCANGSFLTPGLPWDNRSIMGATGDWCYDNSSGGFIAAANMGGAATQTRSVTCNANYGTGAQVDNSLCSGVSPAVSQPCTSCMSYENHLYSQAEWTTGEQDIWNNVAVCTDGTTTAGAQQDTVVNGGWLGGASGGGGIPGSLWNVSPWVKATSCPAGFTQERTVYCAGSFNTGGDSGNELINVYPDSLCLTDPTRTVSFDVDGNAIYGTGPPVPKPAQCR
jgi:hypothetical protein